MAAIASSTGAARSNAAGAPEAITVMLPPSAPARPPETGASSIRSPASVRRCSNPRAASGATVVEQITTAPCGSRVAQPCAPNSTSWSCAAFTTRISSASRSSGSASGRSTAAPPAAASASRAAGRRSQPVTWWPLRTRFIAAPMPMVPSPITPIFIRACSRWWACACRCSAPVAEAFHRRRPARGGCRVPAPNARRPARSDSRAAGQAAASSKAVAGRADHVVAALHDLGRDVADPVHPAEQPAGRQEQPVREIIRLDPREPQRGAVLGEGADGLRARQQGAGTSLRRPTRRAPPAGAPPDRDRSAGADRRRAGRRARASGRIAGERRVGVGKHRGAARAGTSRPPPGGRGTRRAARSRQPAPDRPGRRRAPASSPRSRRTAASARGRDGGAASRCRRPGPAVVLSARLPSGRERPAPRWSKMTTRQNSGSKKRRCTAPAPAPGPPCRNSTGRPRGLPTCSQYITWPADNGR